MAVITTNKQIVEAVKRSKANTSSLITATKVKYVPSVEALILNLSNGLRFFAPREQLQGLRDAPQKKVARVELVGGGSGLHWPELDVDLSVDGLIHGVYGTKEWMSNFGRLGDSVRSKAKAEAARRNGMKGGRPKLVGKSKRRSKAPALIDEHSSKRIPPVLRHAFPRDNIAFGLDFE